MHYSLTNLAPILVQVYTRKQHFVNCIESLSKCRLAEYSDLIILSDAPKTKQEQSVVEDIRKYCSDIKGFASVELIANLDNLGSAKSVIKGVERVFRDYDTMIYTEDDNVFSPNFLEYMNEGLVTYKNDPRIFSLCGFCPPIRISNDYPYDIFVHPAYSAWGSGHWKDKYLKVDFYASDFRKYMSNKAARIAFKREMTNHVYYSMLNICDGKSLVGDMTISSHCCINDMLNVYPIVSLVQNKGWDGSGEHCGANRAFSNQTISDGKVPAHLVQGIQRDNRINQEFHRYILQLTPFRKRLLSDVKFYIKKVISFFFVL